MGKINVLFMQSQTFYGADTMIHGMLMRYLDREWVNVHVACNFGDRDNKSAALQALKEIPDLHVRPTHFGASVSFRSRQDVLKDAISQALPALRSMGGLVRYAKQHQIDIVHCTEKPRDAFLGFLLSRLIGARCLIHLHVKAENWISPLVRWAMRHADGLVGVSEFVAQSIVALGYPASKTYHVLNSLDLSRWSSQDEGKQDAGGWNDQIDGAAIRQEFHIPSDMALLGVVSRLNPWKGHTELFKALAKVKEQTPDFKLLVVGVDDPRATPGYRSYSAELKALASELQLNDWIIFTGYRRDIPQIMAACDIYTMPSFEEPFGMVYLEAMAMRKPVIALDNGGAREIIEHEKSGLLSLPQDIDTLAANIVALIQRPELRAPMGAHGRRRVEEYFTPERMARDVEQIYREILGKADIVRQYRDLAIPGGKPRQG